MTPFEKFMWNTPTIIQRALDFDTWLKNLCEIYSLVYSTLNFDTIWKIHVKYTNQYTESLRFWHLGEIFMWNITPSSIGWYLKIWHLGEKFMWNTLTSIESLRFWHLTEKIHVKCYLDILVRIWYLKFWHLGDKFRWNVLLLL